MLYSRSFTDVSSLSVPGVNSHYYVMVSQSQSILTKIKSGHSVITGKEYYTPESFINRTNQHPNDATNKTSEFESCEPAPEHHH